VMTSRENDLLANCEFGYGKVGRLNGTGRQQRKEGVEYGGT